MINIKRLSRVVISKGLNLLSARKLLCALFFIDNWLYYFQTQAATRYNNGIHPKHRLTQYHNFFVDRIQDDEKVLDIGCGIGVVAFDLAGKTGEYVVGIDINPKNISLAREKHQHENVRYICQDIFTWEPDQCYDTVILSNVLEHLKERSKLLQKLRWTVNPSRFLIRVPLFERDWRIPLKKELGLEWRLDPTHVLEYSFETFENEIRLAGLTIKSHEIRWGEIWAEIIPQEEI